MRRTLRRRLPLPGDHTTRENDTATRFRERHVRLGVILSLATLGEVAGYALLGHPHAGRFALIVLSSSAAIATAGLWVIGPVMARHRHQAAFFLAWSSSVVVVILLGTALDGGERSPLASLLFLPLLYAALSYRPRVVLFLGVVEVIGYLGITFADATPTTAYATLLAATLSLTALMATQSARNREEQAGELHTLALKLEGEATRDGLTACLNRRGFDAAIEAEVARAIRYHRPMSLLVLDVDHLKAINDEYGHAGGDAALQEVGSALHRAGRPNDLVARLGGDEFALVVPETGVAGALELAERTHAALRAATGVAGVSVSIGAATLTSTVTTADQLMRAADGALYAAKHAGRGRTASSGDVPPTPAEPSISVDVISAT